MAVLLGVSEGTVGVIGGTEVFGLFLDRYDSFYLSRAPGVHLSGGRPVFPEVPTKTPEEVLTRHGLKPSRRRSLMPKKSWRSSVGAAVKGHVGVRTQARCNRTASEGVK